MRTIPGHVVEVAKLPLCNMCESCPAIYDAKLNFGTSWAYLCKDCFAVWGLHTATGVGKAQRLILKRSKE